MGSGNTLLTDRLVTLPGVNTDFPISLAWNSSVAATGVPSAVTNTAGSGWSITGFDQRLVSNSDNSVTYFGPAGLTGVFTPIAGTARYTTPSQFKAALVSVPGAGWSLTTHGPQDTLAFNAAGRLTTLTDKNGNVTTFGYDSSGYPATIVSSRGGWSATNPTVRIGTVNGHLISMSQQTANMSRTVRFGYSAAGNLNSVSDAGGNATQFASAAGTDAPLVASITAPAGARTTLTYSSGKTSSISQANTATGSPGTSVTRLTYPSATQTLSADPTTDQGQAVSAVPHTTYAVVSGSQLVSSATDPGNHIRSAQYTGFGDTAQTTVGGGTTTLSHPGTVNGGESLTGVQSPGGASDTATYGNTGKAQYLPSSTSDDASNSLTYTYDGVGNQQSTAVGAGPQANVGYNRLGQPTSSQTPGAGSGVQTTYAYDGAAAGGTNNLVRIVGVSGAGLGTRTFTWDDFGRLATASDGRGNTITYGYDQLDRITSVDYSDTTTNDVSYSYDANGRLRQRVDGSGTTTYTYDDLGNLLTTSNTAGGGTEKYTYDLAGALASKADNGGTTTYTYDASHLLSTMTYPQAGATQTARFGYDGYGQRTDIWFQSNATHSTWQAHESTTYDSSGRVISVLGQNGPASSPTTVVGQTACYQAGTTAPTCTTSAAADRHKIQWIVDSVSGETTTYAYDTNSRLQTATVTGGTNPRVYTYGYSDASNRTSATVTGSSPSSQTLTYNNANQISTAGYAYDRAGNQTATPVSTATYNTAAQTTSVTESGITSSYTYAGTNANELLSATNQSGRTYHYVYGKTDQNDLPVIEQVAVDGVSTNAYVQHDPTTGAPLLLHTTNDANSFYMNDITGNPVSLSTNARTIGLSEIYDPYGAGTQTSANSLTTVDNPYLFHYGIQDRTTGNVKYGVRWYDPTTGAWTQQDDLNAPLDPGNANRYLYSGGDPINVTDPTGRFDFGQFFGDVILGSAITGECFAVGLLNPIAGVACGVVGAVGTAVVSQYE